MSQKLKDAIWAEQKKKTNKEKIERLAQKIIHLTTEIKRWGPKKRRYGMKFICAPRAGWIRHLERMARLSLRATRKQIYRLQDELKTL